MDSKPAIKVLFVCMGNICRSPTAHGVFQEMVRRHGLQYEIEVDSAGTHAYHIGKKPDVRACKIGVTRGYDLSALKARKVSSGDFDEFDYIFAMDQENLEELYEISSEQQQNKVALLLDHHPTQTGEEVPDPYYRDVKAFEQVFDMVETACEHLLVHLRNKHRL